MKKRAFLLALLLIVGVVTLAVAQEGGALTYGTVVLGSVPADNAPVQFAFSGTAGDLVTIRVNGATTGMDPNVMLLGPTGDVLASNENLIFEFSRNAAITYRLPATGNYTIVVSGTAGDFLMSLDANPAPTITVLELDAPMTVTLPLADQAQVYAFNTDPFAATTLLIDASSLDAEAYVEVLDANGRRVASLRGDLNNACFSFAPGDELNEIRVAAAPEIMGSLTFVLGRAPCDFSAQPAPPIQTPQGQTFEIMPIDGACTIGSRNNFNVRGGPGLQYPILIVWAARQPLQVVGQSQDGQWYVVQALGVSGWVAASVVVRAGACDQLTVVAPPAAPIASATVGFPTLPTTSATAGTPHMTATAQPTMEMTETVIPPTVEITPEVTATP